MRKNFGTNFSATIAQYECHQLFMPSNYCFPILHQHEIEIKLTLPSSITFKLMVLKASEGENKFQCT